MAWTYLRDHKLHWVQVPYRGVTAHGHTPKRFVLAHGLFIGNLASWYLSCAHPLSAFGHVLLYDLRGHGKSEHTRDGYELTQLAEDLDALLVSLAWDTEPLTLIGHSYGGRILLEWARKHPEQVAQIILVDTPLTPSELPALGLAQLETMMNQPPELNVLIQALPPVLQLALQSSGRRARKILENWWRLLAESSLPKALSNEAIIHEADLSILGPLIFAIYGENSPCSASAEQLLKHLSHPNRLSYIPQAGHYLLNENPAALCEMLISYISES